MMFKLSDIYYNDSLFSEVIERNLNVWCESTGGNIIIHVADDPTLVKENSRIYIKPKSVELLSDLEVGAIDYAFEYKSVAIQHNLSYIELPDYINLGNSSLRDVYSKIKIVLADGSEIKGDAIMYAVTIPNNAQNREMAEKFYDYLMGEEGKIMAMFIASPIKPYHYIIGNYLPGMIFVAVNTLAMIPIIAFLGAWKVFASAIIATLPLIIISNMLGLFIVMRIKKPTNVSAITNPVNMIFTILPPVFYPAHILPESVRYFVLLIPTASTAELARQLSGLSTWNNLWYPLTVLVIWVVLGILISSKTVRWGME